MSNIILNYTKEDKKINGFAKDVSIAEYFENIQLLPLNFLVPITNEEGVILTNETINAQFPLIGQLYQKNETLTDVNVVLITDNSNYESEEVIIKTPKTLFEVLQDSSEELNSIGVGTTSVGIGTTSNTEADTFTFAVGDYSFTVNTKETYTSLYKEEKVKAYDKEKYNFDVIISSKYFNDEIYTAFNLMDDGYYIDNEIKLIPGVN